MIKIVYSTMKFVCCKNVLIIWISIDLFTSVKGSSCPSTQLHVTRMCYKDYYSSTRFLFLDFGDARNFPLQTCNCTLKIKENGTLSLTSNVTPKTAVCGSQIDVIVPRLLQSKRFRISCSGNLTLDVFKDDSVLISIDNVGDKRVYDTHYCYSVSLPTQEGFTISCPHVVKLSTPKLTTTSEYLSTSQATTFLLTSESSSTGFPWNVKKSSTPKVDNITHANAERYNTEQSDDTNISWFVVGGSICGAVAVLFVILGYLVFRRKVSTRSRKSDYTAENHNSEFVIEEITVDEGDGLKENIAQHSHNTPTIPKTRGILSDESNTIESKIQFQPREKRSGSVEILKRDSFVLKTKEKNYIVTSSIPMKTEGKDEPHPPLSRNSSDSSSFDAMRIIDVRAQRSDSISWRKSDTEKNLYYAELQLDNVTTTVVMVENIQKAQKYEDKIRYSDIMTEL